MNKENERNLPVPILGSWPIMIFSDTPLMGSTSAWDAASINTSTVSSKEHLQQDIAILICNIHTPKENIIR